jgi:hypothetical protein
MKPQHFYNLLEADHEGFFAVRQFRGLPSFCKLAFKEGDASLVAYIDGWAVEPSGDTSTDVAAGRSYAEEAIAYARAIGKPAFIAFVLSQIVDKAVIEGKSAPLIEYGFYQRLAQTAFCGALN